MFESYRQAYMPDMSFPDRRIDETKCTRCGRCAETCPSKGYEWEKDAVPKPIGYGGYQQACINCGNCIAVCPAGAITMTGGYFVPYGRYKSLLENRVTGPDPLGFGPDKDFSEIEKDLTEVERTIYKRRSNRLFKDKDISRELIKRILETGRFAPSAGNNQPYRFLVITNQKIIKEFERRAIKPLRLFKNLYFIKNNKRSKLKSFFFSIASFFSPNKFDPRPITAMEKADKNENNIYFNAPVVIIILADKRGISNPDLDAGICAQNMTLAAHSLGLGSCYVSLPMEPLGLPFMSGFRKKLGISSRYRAVTSLALGYPKGKINGIVKRDTPGVDWI